MRYAKVVMINLNIDKTIEHVMNLVNNTRCAICDKIDGQRLRYSCGHTACGDCVTDAEECRTCLTSHTSSLRVDDVLTKRVTNASLLLKACQELLKIDVLNHKRLSEQLKIEKEVFPECIQAPVKYENKRKSLFSYKNKENKRSTNFPGEDTSPLRKRINMENTVSYVHQWLNKNDKDFARKPFKDLNVNTQFNTNNILPKNSNKKQNRKNKNISVLKTNRKRSHLKTTVKNIATQNENLKSIISHQNNDSKRVKNSCNEVKSMMKKDNEESGIFMDNDYEPIIINDSQESVIDKDRNAWLAVLEANKNDEEPTSGNLNNNEANTFMCTKNQTTTKSNVTKRNLNQIANVPFYKKSYLTETCTYCNNIAIKPNIQTNELKITIDHEAFTTTITIENDVGNISKLNNTNSVSVQTDIWETNLMPQTGIKDSDDIDHTKLPENNLREDSQKSDTHSEDLFADEEKHIENDFDQNKIDDILVIEESDSDMEMEVSGPLPVQVDVHRSCDESEYGILGELNNQEPSNRPRRGPRGLTPTSTDSSEKENFNPNRTKKLFSKKKKNMK